AKAVLRKYGSTETQKLMDADIGNSYETASRIIEAGRKADGYVKTKTQPEDKIGFYKTSIADDRRKLETVEREAVDQFNQTVNVEIKNSFIKEQGPLEMV
ncbi:MAG: hypothetical protein WBM69_20915, partial [Desulfobacterales bacterium]